MLDLQYERAVSVAPESTNGGSGPGAKKLWLRLVAVLVLVFALFPCSAYSPSSMIRATWSLQRLFPEFTLAELHPDESWGLGSFDAVGFSRYYFVMRSRRVPGFFISGEYPHDTSRGVEARQLKASVFSGHPAERDQLETLERLWVKTYQSAPVQVGRLTGPFSIVSEVGNSVEVAPEYSSLDEDRIYVFWSPTAPRDWDTATVYFYFDPGSGSWRELPGFDLYGKPMPADPS